MFDPYHKWLGISPEEQPANHYRLLGLRAFESDADVIDSAADRQMAHVQTHKTGPHSALSQKLLNELAAARLCLLDSARKAAYDDGLRAELESVPLAMPAAPVVAQPVYAPYPQVAMPAVPIAEPAHMAPHIAVNATSNHLQTAKRRKSRRSLIQGLSLAATIVLLAAAFYFFRSNTADIQPSGDGQPDSQASAAAAETITDRSNRAPAAVHHTANVPTPAVNSSPAYNANTSNSAPSAEANTSAESKPAPSGDSIRSSVGELSASTPKQPSLDTVEQPARPKRLPAPSGEELAAAEAAASAMFQTEINAAKTPIEQHAVARRLFDRSFSPDLSADVSHQLLKRAAEIAAAAGRYDTACEAIETMAARFETDTVKLKTAALTASDRFAKSLSEQRKLVDAWMDLAKEATSADQYEAARQCCDQAAAVARKTSDKMLLTRAVESAKAAAAVQAAYDVAGAARDRRATHPGDPEAAAAWVRFVCIYKNDWESGLSIWGRGLDEMAHTARQDLARPPFSTEQLSLADRWWDASKEAEEEVAQKRLQQRAAYWYRYAKLGAPRGELPRIQERIDLVDQSMADFPVGQWIDLLKIIDVSKHRLQGQWDSNGNVLAAPGPGDHRLLVPITASGSYELEASLTIGPKHKPEVNFLFPVGSHSCALILFGWNGKISGLHRVDGKHVDNNDTTVRGVGAQRGQRFKLLIEVELAGDEASVDVKINSRPFTRFQGKASRLDLGDFMILPKPNAFGVRSLNAPVIVHSLRLRVHSGVAKSLE
jgi:hypothetical protein